LRPRQRIHSPKAADATDAAVGRNIALNRRARAMTQQDLATMLGISFQQVQKYEKGMNRISSGRLLQIADIFGVPVEQLFDGTRAAPGPVRAEAGRRRPTPPAAMHAACRELLADPQSLRLARAFARVREPAARRLIVGLVERMAR
jgi:transcriptional regulator with XRE-family HTH domain